MHALHEVGRAEEHAPEALLDLPVADPYSLAQHQDLEILPGSPFAFPPPHHQVVIHQNDIDLLSEGVILEGGIGIFLYIGDDPGPFRVPVDVSNAGQIVFVRIDNTGSIAVPP